MAKKQENNFEYEINDAMEDMRQIKIAEENGIDITSSVLNRIKKWAEMKLYITYLGYIDFLVLKEKERMGWSLELKEDENYRQARDSYMERLKQREEILNIILNETDIFKRFDDMGDILTSVPAMSRFHLFYQNIMNKELGFNVDFENPLQFINIYNIGFMNADSIDFNSAIQQFSTFREELGQEKVKK